MLQCTPLSIEYSTVAPCSIPPTLRSPTFVILSEEEPPESEVRETLGAVEVLSRVKVKELLVDMLPAVSVYLTSTVLLPVCGVNVLLHVCPPSTEYSIVAPVSWPLIVSAPSLVIKSEVLRPVS